MKKLYIPYGIFADFPVPITVAQSLRQLGQSYLIGTLGADYFKKNYIMGIDLATKNSPDYSTWSHANPVSEVAFTVSDRFTAHLDLMGMFINNIGNQMGMVLDVRMTNLANFGIGDWEITNPEIWEHHGIINTPMSILPEPKIVGPAEPIVMGVGGEITDCKISEDGKRFITGFQLNEVSIIRELGSEGFLKTALKDAEERYNYIPPRIDSPVDIIAQDVIEFCEDVKTFQKLLFWIVVVIISASIVTYSFVDLFCALY